ncbi:MAG: hypothetical protein HYU36_11895 [Planctomycetes bacterium]|nr:hypothetical protein [Planctomycetota bacterium]
MNSRSYRKASIIAMPTSIEIVPVRPFEDGVEAGKKSGRASLNQRIRRCLRDPCLRETLGEMGRAELEGYVLARLENPPDTSRYPELEDLYPERLDHLRGFARGAGCTLAEAALGDYVAYRQDIEYWYRMYQLDRGPGHCSGVLLVGPDGVLGAHSGESGPPPRPRSYRYRPPKPYHGLRSLRPQRARLVLRKPRTGYTEGWGVTNEKGVGCCAGTSCGVWLDERIEDTWPFTGFPLLRFARDVEHLEELYRRYTLHCWGRASQVWADTTGNGMIVEKSYRRIGIRRIQGDGVLWCTEGHFESPEMSAFLRARRLEYLHRAGKHLGAEDMQYATDCAVRFTRLGELCHEPWGRGYEHMRRILTDHAPFPRAVCRHAGPDTAAYDRTVTLGSTFVDLTHNRVFSRSWIPWKKFCCEVPERVTQYPPRP